MNTATVRSFLRRFLVTTCLIWFVLYIFPFPQWRYCEWMVEGGHYIWTQKWGRKRHTTRWRCQVDLLTGHVQTGGKVYFITPLWFDGGYATPARDNSLFLEWNEKIHYFDECRLIHYRINRITHQITRTITKADGC